jgi:acyl-CoA thioester hydrolase
MDAMGHVNNIVYLQYFESARVFYSEKIMGIPVTPTDFGLIMASTSCKYKAPVAYPDSVIVGCRTEFGSKERINAGEFTQHYTVVSAKSERVVAEGEALMIVFDYINNKRIPIPEDVLKRVTEFEGA